MIMLRRVTLREIALPLREPFRISSGVVKDRRILLLELEDVDGVRAWSECVAPAFPNYSPETIDTAWLALRDWIVPFLFRSGSSRASQVHDALEGAIRGHRMAKAGLEMGLWVLEAERLGLPLANLLGGTRSWVDVGVSLGIEASPAALADRAEREAAQGYRKIKLKIAPGLDLAYVEAVRDRLGPDVSLMVDANAAYTEKDFDHLEKLDVFGLSMIEQPLHSEDLRLHAELQKRLGTPICLDESVTGPERADDMIAMESGRIINIKPGRVGGFTSSHRIHDRAAKVGMPVWCGGMLESGIGRACNVALASLPNFTMPGDLSPSRRYWEQDIVTPEWTMEPDGRVQVPNKRAGLGVEVDEDRIQGLTRSEFTLLRDR